MEEWDLFRPMCPSGVPVSGLAKRRSISTMRSTAVGGFGVAIAGAIDAGAGAGIGAASKEAGSNARDAAVSLFEQPKKVSEIAHRKMPTSIDPGLLL